MAYPHACSRCRHLPQTRFVIRAVLLLYTLAMVAVLSYLHFAFVGQPSELAALIARAASEAKQGGGFHILEVTMTEPSTGVAFELPNGTRAVWEAPDSAGAADGGPASWQQHHSAGVEWTLRAAQGLFGGPVWSLLSGQSLPGSQAVIRWPGGLLNDASTAQRTHTEARSPGREGETAPVTSAQASGASARAQAVQSPSAAAALDWGNAATTDAGPADTAAAGAGPKNSAGASPGQSASPAASQPGAAELTGRLLWAAVDHASPAAREVLRLVSGDWWWVAHGARAVVSSLQEREPRRALPASSLPGPTPGVQSQPLSFQIAHRRGVLYIADDNDVAATAARRGAACDAANASADGRCPDLPPHSRAGADWLRTARLLVPENFRALGSPAARTLLQLGGGQDVPFIVAAFDAFNGSGFVRAVRRRHVFALSKGHDVAVVRQSVASWMLFKFGTLCSALFVVSAATGLTSFVFNETQRRMVRFTLALGHAVQRRRPVLRLVIAHSVESLVFVPIMIGLLFFMFEFFGDKLLAFLVFMALWACEVFAVVACRTVQSVRVFPVTALLCLTWLMVYVLVFPFGLHHLALACVFSALTCSAYHQWTSFELPALEHGRLSEATPRETIVVSPAQGLTTDLIRNLQRGSAVLDAGLGIGGGRLPMQEVIAGMTVRQPPAVARQFPAARPLAPAGQHMQAEQEVVRQAGPVAVAAGSAAVADIGSHNTGVAAAPGSDIAQQLQQRPRRSSTAPPPASLRPQRPSAPRTHASSHAPAPQPAAAAAVATTAAPAAGTAGLQHSASSARMPGSQSPAPPGNPSALARAAAAAAVGAAPVRDVAAEAGIEDDGPPLRRRRPVRAVSEASASAAHASAVSALGSLLDTTTASS